MCGSLLAGDRRVLRVAARTKGVAWETAVSRRLAAPTRSSSCSLRKHARPLDRRLISPSCTPGRGIVVRSFEQSIYEPCASADWDAAIVGFDALVSATR